MRLIDADALMESVKKWLPEDPCGKEEKEFPFETDICVSMLMEIEEAQTIEPEPSQVAKDIARIVENEQDMRVIAQPEIIYCKDCAKHNKKVGFDENFHTIWKEDACPLASWRGKAQGHEFDYQFCCFAERREATE